MRDMLPTCLTILLAALALSPDRLRNLVTASLGIQAGSVVGYGLWDSVRFEEPWILITVSLAAALASLAAIRLTKPARAFALFTPNLPLLGALMWHNSRGTEAPLSDLFWLHFTACLLVAIPVYLWAYAEKSQLK